VTAVIDSGQSRQAAYDPARDLDTLHLGWISRQSATQRAGRAGRLGPGRCLRLWAKSLESSMPEAFAPEIARLDLNRLALSCAALPAAPSWLTPPPTDRWERAEARLRTLKALDPTGGITPLGRRLLRYPIPPALARVLIAAQEAGCAALVAAMIALVEVGDRKTLADEGDLYLLGLALAREPQGRAWGREVLDTYRQLRQLAKPNTADEAASLAPHPFDSKAERDRRRAVTECWLAAFPDRLAFRQDKAFQLADGRKGMVSAGDPQAALLLAIALHETGGGQQNRRVTIPLYLPCEPGWVDAQGEPIVICTWDAARQRVMQERHWRLGGLTLRKEALPPDTWDRAQAEALIVEKLMSGEIKLANLDEDVAQLILRIRLAARTWPEDGIPRLDDEDWQLIYHELIQGKSSPQDVSKESILEVLREYVGWAGMHRIDREAPRTFKLPSGRMARITYFEDAAPELSARLGDMLGLNGTMQLYEGRVQVLFDILAPNFRTVQKTFDMTGFWANTYPEVKKELKRRYPKHPWP
jgi:ATP-dependent helicase HrpB